MKKKVMMDHLSDISEEEGDFDQYDDDDSSFDDDGNKSDGKGDDGRSMTLQQKMAARKREKNALVQSTSVKESDSLSGLEILESNNNKKATGGYSSANTATTSSSQNKLLRE